VPDLHPPPLAEPYRSALAEALRFIFDRFEPIGVVASGTIVRGNPSPSSDLDLFVLHRQPWRQRLQRFFRSVPAELFVNPPERVERYFEEEAADGRPITAHMLATGAVVYAADPVVEQLRARAAALLAAPPTAPAARLTALRYAAASQLEDGLDVAESDPATAQFFLNRAVDTALALRFWQAARWQPRGKELLAQLAVLDPPLADAARRFFAAPTHAERIALARLIVEGTAGATGFFEWESEPG
jgi:predicted nucleotidyltransferase